MKCTVATMCLLSSSLLASAQYNDSVRHYASYASTGTYNQTNSSTAYFLSNNVKLGMRRKDLSVNATGGWVYGNQQNRLTNNDVSSALDFNLYRTFPHFYYWGLATYTQSYSLKINAQGQAGLGVAYVLIDKKNTTLNISNGVLYELSDVTVKDTISNKYATYRNSFRVTFKYSYKDALTLSGIGFVQQSFLSSTDYILKGNLNLSLRLRKWLHFTTAYSYNRFNRTNRENTLFTYGLTLEKYF